MASPANAHLITSGPRITSGHRIKKKKSCQTNLWIGTSLPTVTYTERTPHVPVCFSKQISERPFGLGPRCYRQLLPSELRTCEGSLQINLFSGPHCLRQRIVCSKQTSLRTSLHHESQLLPTVPYIRRSAHVPGNLLIPHITTKGCIIF